MTGELDRHLQQLSERQDFKFLPLPKEVAIAHLFHDEFVIS